MGFLFFAENYGVHPARAILAKYPAGYHDGKSKETSATRKHDHIFRRACRINSACRPLDSIPAI